MLTVRRSLVVLLVLANTLVFGADYAFACQCAPPGLAAEESERADAVFAGQVIDVLDPLAGAKVVGTSSPLIYTFEVSRVWKGPKLSILRVESARSGVSCGRGFQIGEEYLVYASDSQDLLRDSMCSRTALLSQAKGDLEFLNTIPSEAGSNLPLADGVSRSSWQIRLEMLKVADAQEEGLLSDGDEPYFVVIGFRSRFNTPGSTSAFWSGYLNEDWADGVDDGDKKYIPQSMGLVSFTDVKLVTADDIMSGKMPELLGAIVISMESDATPFGSVRDLMNRGKGALERELRRLIENGGLDLRNPGSDVSNAMHRVQSSIKPDVVEAIGLWLSSWGDPDDIIDYHVFLFAAVDPQVPFPIPAFSPKATVGTLRAGRFTIGSNPIQFKGDGATYEVSASIDPVIYSRINLKPVQSGKCLDVKAEDGAKNGAGVQQWDCYGPGQTNQIWSLLPAGEGYFQIVAMHSNKCLDVRRSSKDDGAIVQQYACGDPGTKNQLWRLQAVGGGAYQIIAKHSSKCLDVRGEEAGANGARVQQWKCKDERPTNQLWTISNP
jgi:hypothetical protein